MPKTPTETWYVYIARCAAVAGMGFQASLAAAFGLWVGIQAMVNIGVNIGVLPTKGLTLPFMSYGGSSIVTNFVLVAMLLIISHRTRTRGLPPVPRRRRGRGEQDAEDAVLEEARA